MGDDSKDVVSSVDDDNDESRMMVAKRRKIGPSAQQIGGTLEINLPGGKATPLRSPSPNPQLRDPYGGRLQMLLERASVERATLAKVSMDPRDRRHKQLLEEMMLVEKSFAHFLKEIETRDIGPGG